MSSQALVRRALMALAIVLLARLPGEAQSGGEDALALPSGTRLRVTWADGSDAEPRETRLVGRLAGRNSSSLRLAVGSSERMIPADSIVRLERSVRPSRKARAALIGFGVGFATMYVLLGVGSEGDCFRGENLGFCAGWSSLLALPAAAVGALVAPGEQWAEVPLPREPRPALRSSQDGLQLRVVPLMGRGAGLGIVGTF
jgi:hypothetical protein